MFSQRPVITHDSCFVPRTRRTTGMLLLVRKHDNMRKEGGPRHILVIDDSEVLLSRIKKALIEDGHMVTTTTQTVGNARHLATCDLVIIDYHMPGINGL